MRRYLLALDQGTTGSAALVFDSDGRVVASADREIRQFYPRPGWVEHDPHEIYDTTVSVGREALAGAGLTAADIAGIGIANQRETTIIWDRTSGEPIHPAVVWQSRASAEICERLKADDLEPLIRQRTGLVVDAYFSGTKIRWLLDHVEGAQERAEAGELLFGTVETWLVWRLTAGRAHVTDVTNASRTMLLNLETCTWDDELLRVLRVPRTMLPTIVASSSMLAEADASVFGAPIPIAGVAGDQQAALFGQACYRPGEAKNTYGTGCFLLSNCGAEVPRSDQGLLSTIAWDLGNGPSYALEGSAFTTGAAVQWLRDGLGIISEAAETDGLARSVQSTDGLYLVPAFTGLGAPDWDMYARGLMVGITRGTTRAHLVRATLESIAYQTRDLVETMALAGQPIHALRVDGGGTANEFLMQFQADILHTPVEVSSIQETTALGAALLAGLAVGLWPNTETLRTAWSCARRYEPRMGEDQRQTLYSDWRRAVERAKGWAARE